jgi:L-fuconolactonase
MLRIDAHNHFWKFDPVRDSWIDDSMQVIRRDFLPEDLQPLLSRNDLDGCIAVQADQSEAENQFLLQLAAEYSFIRGIVGWVDLQSNHLKERLSYYKGFPSMKGFRHILQGEKDRALMLQPAFKSGIAQLKEFGFTYDILIYPDQIGYAVTLCNEFPSQPFVIDHLAKPVIKKNGLQEWAAAMEGFRNQRNVYCKISGMLTEADWAHWKAEDFKPYMDTVLNIFGINRVMFGSDWPVCLLAGNYNEVFEITQKYFSQFSEVDQSLVFGGNAQQFYSIN